LFEGRFGCGIATGGGAKKRRAGKTAIGHQTGEGQNRALHRAAFNCARAAQIRHVISTARDSAIGNGQQVQAGTAFGDWLIWAECQAGRIDPLKENPVSILDRFDKIRPRYESFYGYREAEPRFDFPKPFGKVK
jgi:hypothetical protein